MSNSSLVTFTKISPNKTSPRNNKIDTITIHCMAVQWTAEQCGAWFAQTAAACSSNYGVGKDGSIGLYVDEKDRSWCSSSGANDNRAITIEVASDTTHPYAITDAAYKSLINLLVDICKRNGIAKLVWSNNRNDRINHLNGVNMTCHRDFANKACPGDYIYSREGAIANEVNARLGGKVEPEKPAVTPTPAPAASDGTIKVGSLVEITGNQWYGGGTIPAWVKACRWYVSSMSGKRIVIDKSEDGKYSVRSAVHVDDLKLVNTSAASTPTQMPSSTGFNVDFNKGDVIDSSLGLTVSSTVVNSVYTKVRTSSWTMYVPKNFKPTNNKIKVVLRTIIMNTCMDNIDIAAFNYYEKNGQCIFFGADTGKPYEYEIADFCKGIKSMLNLISKKSGINYEWEIHTNGHSGGDVAAVRWAAQLGAKTCLLTDTADQGNDKSSYAPTADDYQKLRTNRTAICIVKSASYAPENNTANRFERTMYDNGCTVLEIRADRLVGHNDLQSWYCNTNIPLVIMGQESKFNYKTASPQPAKYSKFTKLAANSYTETPLSDEEFIKYCRGIASVTPTVITYTCDFDYCKYYKTNNICGATQQQRQACKYKKDDQV